MFQKSVNQAIVKNLKTSTINKVNLFLKSFFESLQIIITALGFVAIITLFVAVPTSVQGSSMDPNLTTNDILITEKLSSDFGNLKRGDIIAFHATIDKDFVKRIIGLPGDTIKLQKGKVYINNTQLKEDYLSESNKIIKPGPMLPEGVEIKILNDQYIVFGDNREVSYDSRYIGPISKDKIVGKALVRIWPPDKFIHFDSPNYNLPK